jgi:magnesium-transporting ATPase (P-type)
MDRPPRSRKEKLLSRKLFVKAFLWYGILESIVALSAYFFVNYLNGWPGVPLAAAGMVYRQATGYSECHISMKKVR